MKTLKRNDIGKDVQRLQKLLNDYGFKCGISDGRYGPKTEAAVKLFQKKRGLKSNGVADIATQKALMDETLEYFDAWGFIGLMHEKGYKFMVQQYQAAMGLKPDAVIGAQTIAALTSPVIVSRFTENHMSCQCIKYCSGYPQGEISIGVRLMAERIIQQTAKAYPNAKFYVTNRTTPAPNGAIAGGYRCAKWNKLRGGAAGSMHKACIAVDIACDNSKARAELEKNALSMNKYGGTGYGAHYIVHIDLRGKRARWKY